MKIKKKVTLEELELIDLKIKVPAKLLACFTRQALKYGLEVEKSCSTSSMIVLAAFSELENSVGPVTDEEKAVFHAFMEASEDGLV